ncbi:MAG: hypothetical protein A3K19_11790 [Lentisphaerae bacterium RIFOXYB12_FULL_65_16]|nr:MAG: hypothetical protein A3K18_23260 [Lentisphaerae bacterium RIFOXYA12_64_32]OGV87993.1 MAG: hypothetical protein A3K19_11790 [Lentisphaerae bacterium RIFOXYB12_FULL_65_16]
MDTTRVACLPVTTPTAKRIKRYILGLLSTTGKGDVEYMHPGKGWKALADLGEYVREIQAPVSLALLYKNENREEFVNVTLRLGADDAGRILLRGSVTRRERELDVTGAIRLDRLPLCA